MARRLLREWSPQVAQFFGVQPRQLTLHFGQTDTAGAAAEANQTTGEITMSRDFLRNATREDLRGNLIHEATHALGVGFGKSSQKVETLADYARYRLNPNEDWEMKQLADKFGITHQSATAFTKAYGPMRANVEAAIRSKKST